MFCSGWIHSFPIRRFVLSTVFQNYCIIVYTHVAQREPATPDPGPHFRITKGIIPTPLHAHPQAIRDSLPKITATMFRECVIFMPPAQQVQLLPPRCRIIGFPSLQPPAVRWGLVRSFDVPLCTSSESCAASSPHPFRRSGAGWAACSSFGAPSGSLSHRPRVLGCGCGSLTGSVRAPSACGRALRRSSGGSS